MIMLFHLVFFAFFLCYSNSQQCGINKYMREGDLPVGPRIVGGTDAREGAWPWLVALATRVTGNSATHIRAYFKCGGSLITSRHVLTAAHCCDENLYLARLGVSYLHSAAPVGIDVLIERTVVHRDFDVARAYNDIAIVILNERVKFNDNIRPICLPKKSFSLHNTYENITSVVAGWGDVNFGSETGSSLLQEVRLPVYNLKECQKMYEKYHTNVTRKNICVGYKMGGKDACQGDSGGPLMAKGPLGKFYFVIGVISHGLGCGMEGIPGIYTRVSSYLPWIKKIIKNSKKYLNNFYEHKKRKELKSFVPAFSEARYRGLEDRSAAKKMFLRLNCLVKDYYFGVKTCFV